MTLARDRLVEEGHYDDLGLQVPIVRPRDRVVDIGFPEVNEPSLTHEQLVQQRQYKSLCSNEITIHFGLSE